MKGIDYHRDSTGSTLFYVAIKRKKKEERRVFFLVYDSKMRKKDPEAQYRDIQ